MYEHIKIIEDAIGKPIPKNSETHHVNGIKSDNSRGNLVLCEDTMYHNLLHKRINRLKKTGNKFSEKCRVCGNYESPKNLIKFKDYFRHGWCFKIRLYNYKPIPKTNYPEWLEKIKSIVKSKDIGD